MKGVLDDDASIYQRSAEREGTKPVKGTWKRLDKAGKKQYFKDYFLKICLAILVLVIFVVCFIYVSTWEDKENMYSITSLDETYLSESSAMEVLDELSERWNIKKDETLLYHIDLPYDGPLGEKNFPTYLYAGTVDVVIGTKEQLARYGEYYEKLDLFRNYDIIPKDALVTLTYMEADMVTMEATEKTKTCGIYLKDTVFAKCYNEACECAKIEDLIIVLVETSNNNKKYDTEKEDFIKFLLHQ